MAQRPPSPRSHQSSLGQSITEEQRKAIERLADYPRRVERLRMLWIETHEESQPPPRATASSSTPKRAGGGTRSSTIPRGGPLTAAQIRELMNRELTPEDYELLLLLDEGVKKAKTLSPEVAAALPRATGTDWLDDECGICLCALEEDEDVRMLPGCGHHFHAPCAERWLTTSKATCPLCGREEARQEKVMDAFKQFDTKAEGMFEVDDMKRVLTKLDPAVWTHAEVDRLFAAMDRNQDGKINTQEFVDWLFAVEGGEQQRLRSAMDL